MPASDAARGCRARKRDDDIGTIRLFLRAVVNEIDAFGIDVTDKVIHTGDLRHTPDSARRCRMFRWRERRAANRVARQPLPA